MLTVVASKDNSRIISIPADEMEKLGFSNGDEVELSKENDEIILRSTTEAERKRKFEDAKNKIFEEWNDVFVELARGVEDNSQRTKAAGKFNLFATSDDQHGFNLTAENGQIIFQSAHYKSRKEASDAIDSLRRIINAVGGEMSDFTVEDNLETA